MLENKSITELRGIAQSFGISDIFQKDPLQLRQAIEQKQRSLIPAQRIEVARPPYDSRLMTKPPSKQSSRADLEKLLQPYIIRGINLTFDDNGEHWFMSFDKKTDEGTMRMPLRAILRCAEKMLG